MQALADFTATMTASADASIPHNLTKRRAPNSPPTNPEGGTYLLHHGRPVPPDAIADVLQPLLEQARAFPEAFATASGCTLPVPMASHSGGAGWRGEIPSSEDYVDAAHRSQLLAVQREGDHDDLDARRIDGQWYVDLATPLGETALVISPPKNGSHGFSSSGHGSPRTMSCIP